MRELKSYSIDELEELTGFDRRTVSYYISEGLLPKVGRRGPKTRYGQEFVDRLKFIERVKELQDAGKLPSVKLEDIARLLNRLEEDEMVTSIKSQKSLQELFARALDELQELHQTAPPPDMFTGEAGIGDQMSIVDGVDQAGFLGISAEGMEPVAWSEELAERMDVAASVGSFSTRRQREQFDELQEQLAVVRDLSERGMRSDKLLQDELPRLFKLVERQSDRLDRLTFEVRALREQMERDREEAMLLMKRRAVGGGKTLYQKAPPPVSRKFARETNELLARDMPPPKKRVEKQPGLQDRARMFAKKNGLPLKDLRTGRLRGSAGADAFWEFRLSPADLERETLTLLCEGRATHPKDGEFVALEIPAWFLATPLMSLLKEAHGKSVRLRLSASDSNLFELLEIPGIELAQFRSG